MSGRILDADLEKIVESARGDAFAYAIERQLQGLPDTIGRTIETGQVRQVAQEVRTARKVAASVAAELLSTRKAMNARPAAGPSSLQTCDNCQFSYAVPTARGDSSPYDNGDREVVVCRRNPPGVRVVGTGEHETTRSVFPPIVNEQWCGEWRRLGDRRVGE